MVPGVFQARYQEPGWMTLLVMVTIDRVRVYNHATVLGIVYHDCVDVRPEFVPQSILLPHLE